MRLSMQRLSLLAVVLTAAIAFGLLQTSTASAEASSNDTTIEFSGVGDVHDVLDSTITGCIAVVPPVPPLVPGVWACLRLTDVTAQVAWEAEANLNTTWDTDQLHQGSDVTVDSSLDGTSGSMKLSYTAYEDIGVYICDPFDFDGPDGLSFIGCGTIEEASDISQTVTTSASCVPTFSAFECDLPTGTLQILPPALSGYVIGLEFEFNRTFQVAPAGVSAERTATGSAPAGKLFPSNEDPTTLSDTFALACSQPVGSLVDYGLSGFTHAPQVTTDLETKYNLIVAGFDVTLTTINDSLVDTILMSGEPPVNLTLGSTLADNQAPTIASILEVGAAAEGAVETFTGIASDNCGVEGYEWEFSDGGSAFGQSAGHTFSDNGSYTGRLTVVDAAGNEAVEDFDTNAISNVDPTLLPPPGASGVWGQVLHFQAAGIDPGSTDQATLTFGWSFDDGSSASGAAVAHAFAEPGTYEVEVTVTDKDGGSDTATVPVTIAKRDSVLVYDGQTKALPKKDIELSASLSDELGAPIANREVTFTLGSGSSAQVVTAVTNANGDATVVIRNSQKNGTHSLTVTFDGDARYEAAPTVNRTFLVGK